MTNINPYESPVSAQGTDVEKPGIPIHLAKSGLWVAATAWLCYLAGRFFGSPDWRAGMGSFFDDAEISVSGLFGLTCCCIGVLGIITSLIAGRFRERLTAILFLVCFIPFLAPQFGVREPVGEPIEEIMQRERGKGPIPDKQ